MINGSKVLLIGELINRKTANINVKKLQFIHTLTATDVHASKTAKLKKLFYYAAAHRHTSMCSGIVYNFFIFAVLDA